MSEPSANEVDLKLQVLSAQTDAKFERVLGEMRAANASIIGKLEAFGTELAATKAAAQEASSRTVSTRWQVFFLVLGFFGSVVAVAALVLANTSWITGLVQTVAAIKH